MSTVQEVTQEVVTTETTEIIVKSMNYEKIKAYYNDKRWTIDRVSNVVGKSTGITETEYTEITGFTYPNKA